MIKADLPTSMRAAGEMSGAITAPTAVGRGFRSGFRRRSVHQLTVMRCFPAGKGRLRKGVIDVRATYICGGGVLPSVAIPEERDEVACAATTSRNAPKDGSSGGNYLVSVPEKKAPLVSKGTYILLRTDYGRLGAAPAFVEDRQRTAGNSSGLMTGRCDMSRKGGRGSRRGAQRWLRRSHPW
jgi:hypothetical protein